MPRERPALIAFGPEMPDWGSWQWAGADVRDGLRPYFDTLTFQGLDVPQCDAVFFVKHAPPHAIVEQLARRSRVVYCPVDYYGSASAIDQDSSMLRLCARVLVHCERLRKYFEPYAPVEYIDHHVKFIAERRGVRDEGPGASEKRTVSGEETPIGEYPTDPSPLAPNPFILWVGVRTNLPPLVEWANRHPLPYPLWVLTNVEDPPRVPSPQEFGFRPDLPITIEHWTAERQIERTAQARAAIDIKGDDFRSRHKPPAKAIDFIASGLPLAMNPDSSPVEHLARMGFELASPLDRDRWFSAEYAAETRRFGTALRELLSHQRILLRYKRIIEELLGER